MKISIITTCYNREATIAQAIGSVLAQTHPDIEYIVVDGASRDGSLEVIRSYGNRIGRLLSEPDHGMYEAINKGLRLATGDVVGLLHSDDFLFDRHVVADIAACFERTGADLVYGNGLFVDARDTERVVRDWVSGPYRRWKVACGWLPLHPTVYIRREAMEKVGAYDEHYKIAADTDFLLRCLYERHLRVAYLDRYVVRMRMGGLSTDKARRRQMWREDVEIYRRHGFPGVLLKLLKMGWKVPQFLSVNKLTRGRVNKLTRGRVDEGTRLQATETLLTCLSSTRQLVPLSTFFYFLRLGLWGETPGEEEVSLEEGDWQRLFALSREQAVSGLWIDGVSQTACRPSEALWTQCIFHLLHIERMNVSLARAEKAWLDRLVVRGIEAEVFKGSSVACWYRKPQYRSYGDIDLVVRRGWERVEAFLREAGYVYRHEEDSLALQDGRVAVELHPCRETVYNPFLNVRLQRMLAADRWGVELYVACLLLHVRRHVLSYGIGLKQVCDVAVMLRRAPLDGRKLAEILRRLHLVRFSRALFGFMEARLGEGFCFPFPPLHGRPERLLEDILFKDGYRLKMEREALSADRRQAWKRIGGNACFWLVRSVRLWRLMPGEAFFFLCQKAAGRLFGRGH